MTAVPTPSAIATSGGTNTADVVVTAIDTGVFRFATPEPEADGTLVLDTA